MQKKDLSPSRTSVHVSGCTSYQPSLNGAETENIDNNPLDFSAAHSRNTISKLKGNKVQSIGKHTQETARILAPNPIFQTQGGLSFDRNSSQAERIKQEALLASGDQVSTCSIKLWYINIIMISSFCNGCLLSPYWIFPESFPSFEQVKKKVIFSS